MPVIETVWLCRSPAMQSTDLVTPSPLDPIDRSSINIAPGWPVVDDRVAHIQIADIDRSVIGPIDDRSVITRSIVARSVNSGSVVTRSIVAGSVDSRPIVAGAIVAGAIVARSVVARSVDSRPVIPWQTIARSVISRSVGAIGIIRIVGKSAWQRRRTNTAADAEKVTEITRRGSIMVTARKAVGTAAAQIGKTGAIRPIAGQTRSAAWQRCR